MFAGPTDSRLCGFVSLPDTRFKTWLAYRLVDAAKEAARQELPGDAHDQNQATDESLTRREKILARVEAMGFRGLMKQNKVSDLPPSSALSRRQRIGPELQHLLCVYLGNRQLSRSVFCRMLKWSISLCCKTIE